MPEIATKQDLREAVEELRLEFWKIAIAIMLGTATLVTFVQKLVP